VLGRPIVFWICHTSFACSSAFLAYSCVYSSVVVTKSVLPFLFFFVIPEEVSFLRVERLLISC